MVVGAGCVVWIPAFAGMTVGGWVSWGMAEGVRGGCVNMGWQSLGYKV